MKISEELARILACPKCKGPVEIKHEENRIVCGECNLAYPVRDDIPVMIISEATPWR